MTKKVIGIISYLPEDSNTRKCRIARLQTLLSKCKVFSLPIIIIAQNWSLDDEMSMRCVYSDLLVYNYDKPLGIVGARKELRLKFLSLDFDTLIMLDDDCDLEVKESGAKLYLEEIDKHHNKVGMFRGTLLKLFAIPKTIFEKIDFRDNINPEDGTGFEDTVFVNDIKKKFPFDTFQFTCRYKGIDEKSDNSCDKYSTWYKNQDLNDMLNKTHSFIKNNK